MLNTIQKIIQDIVNENGDVKYEVQEGDVTIRLSDKEYKVNVQIFDLEFDLYDDGTYQLVTYE